MDGNEMDLVYRLLDDQLVDIDGRRCGRVDDLEFDDDPEAGVLRLGAILSGSGVWHRRLPRPFRTAGERIFGSETIGGNVIRVPWDAVEDITSVVQLKAKAGELGLAQGDERDARLVAKLPRS